jgi:uncharacterized protein (TIGR00661 family)
VKILYAIAGEGMGHATRSKPIIDFLRRHHTVKIVAGGNAATYLRRYFPVSWIASAYLVYRKNSIDQVLTVLLNLVRAPLYVISFVKMFVMLLVDRPQVLITDFEPWSTYAALLTGVRVVSIDNQQVLLHARISLPEHHRWTRLWAWLVIRTIIPFAHATIIPSFFFPQLESTRAQYVSPILRKGLRARRPVQGGHVLVYQTSSTHHELLKVLKSFPRQSFVIYGFPKVVREGNLRFKRFNEREFFDDLAAAKAVISNGGFSLLSEALSLRKPILSIPVQGHCEQLINAHYLQKLNYGLMAHTASHAVLKTFFARLRRYREALKALPRWNPSRELKAIEGVVEHVAT